MAIPVRLTVPGARRIWQTAMLLAVLVLLAHTALILAVRENERLLGVAGNVLLLLESATAAVLTTVAWLRVRNAGSRPSGWALLSLALWVNAVGQGIYLAIEVLQGLVPYPSLADPFFIAFCLLFAVALALLPAAPANSHERVILALEMGAALLAGTLLFSVLGVAPLVANSTDTNGVLFVSLAYPASDVVLFWALGVSLYRRSSLPDNRPLNLLFTAAVLKLLADTLYSYGLSNGGYVASDYPDLALALTMVYLCLAAVLQIALCPAGESTRVADTIDREPEEGTQASGPIVTWRSWLPYVSLLSAFALLVWSYYHPTVVGFPVLASVVAIIIVLLGARQVLALREAESLYRSRQELAERRRAEEILRQARDELEQRVDERTRELQEANTALAREVAEHEQAEARLQLSLTEKEVLIKEVHHRVKNNLQVVSSLLGLQSRKAADGFASELLLESQGRVRTMALIHQKLYASPDLGRINFRDYLQTLLKSLFDSYRVYPGTITLDVDVAEAWLGIDTAVPCGLIVNELVSNALKHAFPDGRKGCVCVRLTCLDGQILRLSVEDDGVGLPPGLDYRRTESLGLQLAVTLTNQLSGTIAVDSTQGAAFHITFAAG